MGSFSLGEFITITIVALIIFGPRRLPEMARRLGQLLNKARRTAADLRKEFDAEYREIAQPITDLRRDMKAFGSELGDTARGALGAIDEHGTKPVSGRGPGEIAAEPEEPTDGEGLENG